MAWQITHQWRRGEGRGNGGIRRAPLQSWKAEEEEGGAPPNLAGSAVLAGNQRDRGGRRGGKGYGTGARPGTLFSANANHRNPSTSFLTLRKERRGRGGGEEEERGGGFHGKCSPSSV